MSDSTRLREALERIVVAFEDNRLGELITTARAALEASEQDATGSRCPNPECRDGYVLKITARVAPNGDEIRGEISREPCHTCTGQKDALEEYSPNEEELQRARDARPWDEPVSGAGAVGVEEAWQAYIRQQPIMYGGEREAFFAAWQASLQAREGWRPIAEEGGK